MNFQKTSCCAINDIDRLQDHKNAKDAMIAFCQQALLTPPKFGVYTGVRDEIFSFYLFTAAVGPSYRPYGQEFHDFIIENKLGDVWASPLRPNKAWHPDHSNQVWVWMPDKDAIKKWWAENDPTKVTAAKVEPKVIPQPPCSCGADVDTDGLCSEGCDSDFEPEWDDEPEFYDERDELGE